MNDQPEKHLTQAKPLVLIVSNLENHYALSRRELLEAIAMGSLAISVAPLLTGCATTRPGARQTRMKQDQAKVKEPTKGKAKGSDELRRDPSEDSEVTGNLEAGFEVTLLDRKGNWLRVRASSGAVGWVSSSSIEITGYTERVVPCGTPLPPGAICLCNCVPSYTCTCNPYTHRTCTCVPVRRCSCVPVCTCNKIPVLR